MERLPMSEFFRQSYKPPTDIQAVNAKLKPEQVKKQRRLNAIKERLHRQNSNWDALEEL